MVMESSRTNWTILSGSLANSITFESSTLTQDQQESTSNLQSSPLVLRSPSPDSAPCEINLSFAAKHELRQIYVRSTARVYEIYTTPNLQSDHEYLCTVRCGVAARDGEVLSAPEDQEIASSHVEGSNKESCEENLKSEDDWVEVKVPDSPMLDRTNIPLQTQSYTNSAKSSQDLFEATAEINDMNPCISVTLRLLSLQSKGYIYIDEIYVFGEPVDSADSESQESRNENSSSSSLMAMFLPTLMQLSKTSAIGHQNADKKEKQSSSAYGLDQTELSDSVIKTRLKGKASITDPQKMNFKEVNEGWVAPSHPDIPSQVYKIDSDHTTVPSQVAKMERNQPAISSQVAPTQSNHGDSLGGKVESVLGQLVSRMDRIEQICLGFQEKMVMPMSSIEARLQQVEQQLDTLTKKLQNSGASACGMCDGKASGIESDVNGHTVTMTSEPDREDIRAEVLSISPDDISNSANTTQLLPGLVVTAPEFPDGDEEDNATGQEEMNSSSVEVKRSIDDVLSSTLANLLCTMSVDSPKYTKSLIVKAPEFLSEDEDDHGCNNDIEKTDSAHPMDSKKNSHTQVSTTSNISMESCDNVDGDSKDKLTEEDNAQEAEEWGQFCSVERNQEDISVTTSIVAEHNPQTCSSNNFEDNQNGKLDVHKTDGFSSSGSGISGELLDNQTASGSSITQEGPSAGTDVTVVTEALKKASHDHIIKNVLGFSLASSSVDFETPLLDVKFISQSPVTDPFLEALLVNVPETNSQDPSVKESGDDLPPKEQPENNGVVLHEEQSILVSVDQGEHVNPGGDSHFAMEKDYYSTLITFPVSIESDKPEDHKRKCDQIYPSSLI